MVLLVYSYSKEVGVRDMLQEFNDLCGWASRLTRLQWQKQDSSRGALPTWVMWECMAGFLQYRGSAPFLNICALRTPVPRLCRSPCVAFALGVDTTLGSDERCGAVRSGAR